MKQSLKTRGVESVNKFAQSPPEPLYNFVHFSTLFHKKAYLANAPNSLSARFKCGDRKERRW